MYWLRRQKTLKTSILYISHNLGVVANIADEVIVMYLGQIVEHARCLNCLLTQNILIP